MASDVDNGKICAILAYLFPIGLIWYLVDDKMRKNKFAGWHVHQSLAAAIVVIIGNVAGTIIPIIGWFVLLPLVAIASLVWFVQGLINSIGGKEKDLLFLGGLAKKFNF